MDLCTTTQAVPTQVPSTLLDNEVQEVVDDPFGDASNDPVVTPLATVLWHRGVEMKGKKLL